MRNDGCEVSFDKCISKEACMKSTDKSTPFDLCPRIIYSHTGHCESCRFVMEAEADELQDWELLPFISSGDDSIVIPGTVDDIRSDYFDLDCKMIRPPASLLSSSEEEKAGDGGIDSDNPSSEDPDSDSHRMAELREEGSDSDYESKMIDSRNERGLSSRDNSDSRTLGIERKEKLEGDCEGGDGFGTREEGMSRVVWWKIPFQILGLCLLKLKPNWPISVAAAIVGFVILGRRLLRMRHKRRNSSVRLAADDKRLSQFIGQASLLNEKLSTVRRVPVISTLPATGVGQWPVVSLR